MDSSLHLHGKHHCYTFCRLQRTSPLCWTSSCLALLIEQRQAATVCSPFSRSEKWVRSYTAPGPGTYRLQPLPRCPSSAQPTQPFSRHTLSLIAALAPHLCTCQAEDISTQLQGRTSYCSSSAPQHLRSRGCSGLSMWKKTTRLLL